MGLRDKRNAEGKKEWHVDGQLGEEDGYKVRKGSQEEDTIE